MMKKIGKRTIEMLTIYTMKKNNYKKLIGMGKKILGGLWMAACMLALVVLVAPCLLILSVGNDGELTVWNFVGLAWAFGIFLLFRRMTR